MIDIKNRVVEHAARYELTLVSGTTYDLVEVPGTITEAGTDVDRTAFNGFTRILCKRNPVFNQTVQSQKPMVITIQRLRFLIPMEALTETFTSNGISIAKKTTFNADGSISEVMI